MRQSGLLFVAFSLICCLLTTTAKAQDQTLQLGTAIERQIANQQSHTFTVTLEENQYVQIVVDQRGVDVVVHVTSPAGKSLGTFDSPNGDTGPEDVAFVGITPGAYRVTVSPLNEAGSGKYEIKIVELRPATEQEIAAHKNLETVKVKGLALLADVDGIMPDIHAAQTRIRAQLQAAQLVWDVDQKRGWKYMNDATTSMQNWVASFDANNQEFANSYDGMMQLRFEIAHYLVERDAEAALNFIHLTRMPPNPNTNEREQAQQERSLEASIANQLVTKDPKRAFQLAQQNLKKGYS